jgi:hypothetical protein
LYFEIQHLNKFSEEALDGLGDAVEAIRKAVQKGEEASFVSLMEDGRKWLAGRPDRSA